MDQSKDPPTPGSGDGQSTGSLLARARAGDRVALDALIARHSPRLLQWAHGRLPYWARDVLETTDLVQITLLKALNHVQDFVPRHEGAFLAYLRQVLLNEVRQEIRRVRRRPEKDTVPDNLAARDLSPLEELVGRETLERYEAALLKLPEAQRAAVILRLEFGFTHEEIAAACESPSANAARMMVKRGLLTLASEMEHASERR
jgi:RNA polymerase sigma factor (sigma-70 family)